MTPIEFKGCNTVYGAGQKEYLPLPAHRGQISGMVTSCWKLTWRERWRVLVTGRLYLSQLTFGRPLQPQLPAVENPVKVDPKVCASCGVNWAEELGGVCVDCRH